MSLTILRNTREHQSRVLIVRLYPELNVERRPRKRGVAIQSAEADALVWPSKQCDSLLF
jgi:hypothetical protein